MSQSEERRHNSLRHAADHRIVQWCPSARQRNPSMCKFARTHHTQSRSVILVLESPSHPLRPTHTKRMECTSVGTPLCRCYQSTHGSTHLLRSKPATNGASLLRAEVKGHVLLVSVQLAVLQCERKRQKNSEKREKYGQNCENIYNELEKNIGLAVIQNINCPSNTISPHIALS